MADRAGLVIEEVAMRQTARGAVRATDLKASMFMNDEAMLGRFSDAQLLMNARSESSASIMLLGAINFLAPAYGHRNHMKSYCHRASSNPS